jgi:dTDP-4-amino-4,6-dideoxygalactose transaminase
MHPVKVPFNRPYVTGQELELLRKVLSGTHLSGDGVLSRECQAWLEHNLGCAKALLTQSCTSALEMTALLARVGPGDEIIMPSFTFVSTANAFALRGAVPVFVDIRPDTLNLDESALEAAITSRTKCIVVVHYAGVACEMDEILSIARRHRLLVIEDAAQGIMSRYKGRALGAIGDLGALSFHETKNVITGEGGALLVNAEHLAEHAEIIWEKGTNRRQFFRGLVDKYTWVDLGSSFLPSELMAACLFAQLEQAESITRRRLALWQNYHEAFEDLERRGALRRPVVPAHCEHNAHLYYLLLPDAGRRERCLQRLRSRGIDAVFHYVPLHHSPAGRRYGRAHGVLRNTEELSERLIRLPLWIGLDDLQARVIAEVRSAVIE